MRALKALGDFGQAVWLDFLSRRFIADGSLAGLVARDGVTGVTSNPATFEKAITAGADYDAALAAAETAGDRSAIDLYEGMAIADIQDAAACLRPVYDATAGADGFVSLEVSPYLAHDTDATIAEARRLWRAVARDNVMIKVPATASGLPAIRQLLGEGINVNITLLFSGTVYEQVAEAFLAGAEHFAAGGGELARLASVASFFVSRIDTAIDERIERALASAPDAALAALRGTIAVANAKLAYRRYRWLFSGPRWDALRAKGARPQRLLWASTGTKNAAYGDLLYVESLIGVDTVNTMPPATMDAFRDHGTARASLEENVEEAERVMAALAAAGIAIEAVCATLVDDGVRLFADAADRLLGAVARKRADFLRSALDGQRAALPAVLGRAVEARLEAWRGAGAMRQMWARDARLWTGGTEADWLGWLDIVAQSAREIDALKRFADEVRRDRFAQALLLGMGGSSLGPEVIAETLGHRHGYPELLVLDSTDPSEIRSIERRIDPARTLFIVASKSGTTLEPNILMQYFLARAKAAVGAAAGSRFIAITDPGSELQAVAEREGFRRVFLGQPSIGGRYCVLSLFGLVPAAAIGLDVAGLIAAAQIMVHSCAACVPPADNPGAVLGAILGVAATGTRDKVTIATSPGLAGFGAWLEQLLAESTGKSGRGIVPVDAETLGSPEVYGADRLFVSMRLEGEEDDAERARLDAIEHAGHPVVRIDLADRYQIGQEFFRWEIATAMAGAIIGVDPFDQPDVEASKTKTRELTASFEASGALPPETPILIADGVTLFADAGNHAAIAAAASGRSLAAWLGTHLARLAAGDYFALLAYIERSERHIAVLQQMRMLVRDRARVATCLGFGPRFLHSTGQAYKGGPKSGVFVQITCDEAAELPVPGRKYGFGIVKAAQARGDFEVLSERGRRALRVHLGADVEAGLATLATAIRHGLDGVLPSSGRGS